MDPYDSPQEWIANVFYEPPKVGRHRSSCPPGSIEKSGMTGCIYETGEGPAQRAWPSRTRPDVSWSSKPMTAYPWLWPDISVSHLPPNFRIEATS